VRTICSFGVSAVWRSRPSCRACASRKMALLFVKEGGGAPFFYLGDTEWTLLNLQEDVDTYLADRRRKGSRWSRSVCWLRCLNKMFIDGDPARR